MNFSIPIEVDMIEFEFRHVDNRLMSMKLVELGLSGAALFGPEGQVLQPSEALHRRRVLLARGSFRPVCHVHLDMLKSGSARFGAEPNTIELVELTLRNLRRASVEADDELLRAETKDETEACAIAHETGRAIDQAIARLPRCQREVVYLRAQGYSLGDIAGELGASAGAVKLRCFRSHRVLRRALSRARGREALQSGKAA